MKAQGLWRRRQYLLSCNKFINRSLLKPIRSLHLPHYAITTNDTLASTETTQNIQAISVTNVEAARRVLEEIATTDAKRRISSIISKECTNVPEIVTVKPNKDNFKSREIYEILQAIQTTLDATLNPNNEDLAAVHTLLHNYKVETEMLKCNKNNTLLQEVYMDQYNENIDNFNSIPNSNEDTILIGPLEIKEEYYWKHLTSKFPQNLPTIYATPTDNTNNDTLRCLPRKPHFCHLQRHIRSEYVRRSLWFEQYLHPLENIQILSKLQRQEISTTANPHDKKNMDELLMYLCKQSKAHAVVELSALKRFQQRLLSSNEQAKPTPLMPWDIPYFQHRYLDHSEVFPHCSPDHTKQKDAVANYILPEYFSLPHCLEGIQLLFKETFQIEMLPIIETSTQETIREIQNYILNNALANNETVNIFVLRDCASTTTKVHGNQPMGIVYLVYQNTPDNPNRQGHTSSECQVIQPRYESNISTTSASSSCTIPVMKLTFTFPLSTNSIRSSNNFDNIPLLTFNQLKSLYHEFGHVLHTICQSTKYYQLQQCYHGDLDFVEIPSQLMEYFAMDERWIQRWARHVDTGKPIPKKLLQHALQFHYSTISNGITLQSKLSMMLSHQKIFHSTPNQASHHYLYHSIGKGPSRVNTMESNLSEYLNALETMNNIQDTHTVLPLVPTSLLSPHTSDYHPQTASKMIKETIVQHLSHIPYQSILQSYFHAEGLQSEFDYLIAQIYAAQLWDKYFSLDPLNKEAGWIIRNVLCSPGVHIQKHMILNNLFQSDTCTQYKAYSHINPDMFLKYYLKQDLQ